MASPGLVFGIGFPNGTRKSLRKGCGYRPSVSSMSLVHLFCKSQVRTVPKKRLKFCWRGPCRVLSCLVSKPFMKNIWKASNGSLIESKDDSLPKTDMLSMMSCWLTLETINELLAGLTHLKPKDYFHVQCWNLQPNTVIEKDSWYNCHLVSNEAATHLDLFKVLFTTCQSTNNKSHVYVFVVVGDFFTSFQPEGMYI